VATVDREQRTKSQFRPWGTILPSASRPLNADPQGLVFRRSLPGQSRQAILRATEASAAEPEDRPFGQSPWSAFERTVVRGAYLRLVLRGR
jgi:hypothetical protein